MRRDTHKWDVRVSRELALYYLNLKKMGNNYFYKLDLAQATEVIRLMSESYNIPPPGDIKVDIKYLKKNNAVGMCFQEGRGTIYMFHRSHIVTILHEFYHHLEFRTGAFDSSDHKRHGHIFGDKAYDLIRKSVRELEGKTGKRMKQPETNKRTQREPIIIECE
jgi:hypothetical protein